MSNRVNSGTLQVDQNLYDFLTKEVMDGIAIDTGQFWHGFSAIVDDLAPENRNLLEERDRLQAEIDRWYGDSQNHGSSIAEQKEFLSSIGYLVPEGPDFAIATDQVDDEVATIAGPQLVVPVTNPRYALNAANARWGSLYDCLYGTDAIADTKGCERTDGFNPTRGQAVVDWARAFLDDAVPLVGGSHAEASGYRIRDSGLEIMLGETPTALKSPGQFVGFLGPVDDPTAILFNNRGLHIEVQFDRTHFLGKTDPTGICDVFLEAALTTIMDCEDSVAAVDADEKIDTYRNWLGLMKGDLQTDLRKNGKTIIRKLNEDRHYKAADGSSICLHGRSLMLVRNVGHLMTSDAILDTNGEEVPEGIMDAVVTSLIALHDLNKSSGLRNSRTGSVYIVKPKMHGPEEVAFADKLFARVEDLLGMPRNTLKMGIMDEERRTTVNLKECIRAAKDRVAFINTGFLDRTGDEIHTMMEAGPVVRKNDVKTTPWISAYEDWNVDVGLACGLPGKAQIGKGMWAMPDLMADMLVQKIAHPEAGANTAWVPSPTAGVLHATHYHRVDVAARQKALKNRKRANIDDILTIPLADQPNWSKAEVLEELENNVQGILGYVVRWIDQGVGCSKVPDINNIGLMEDRATLRISSQHIANWLHHEVCSPDQVRETLERMAAVVDGQNADDPEYHNMSPDFDSSLAFKAASDLIFLGKDQPNGYTEPLLHARRRELKGQV